MAGKLKVKPHQQPSDIKNFLEQSAKNATVADDDCFLISFKHLDKTQGASLEQWDSEHKLHRAMEVLSGYCQRSLRSQLSDKFTIYGGYPPSDKAGYKRPTYISEDAEWARIHINGLQILAGHIYKNTFYVVFLDPDHNFYKTDIQDR